MIAAAAAYAHIVSRLKASTALTAIVGERVYQGVAPADAIYPLVLIQPYSSDDIYFIGHDRIGANVTVSVRVLAESTSFMSVLPAADAIDVALQSSGPGVTEYGTVAQVVRTSEQDLVELVNGTQWRYLGGLYECLVT